MVFDWLACCRASSRSAASDVADERPTFTHKPARAGRHRTVQRPPAPGRVRWPSSAALVVLVAVTTPLGSTGLGARPGRPARDAVPHRVAARRRGCAVGSLAPELEIALEDGTTFQLTDLDGAPIRLDDLRGKVVWINFWASWCPPCQQETPILRELDERYARPGPRDRRDQRPGDLGRRRGGLRRALRARLHDRVRRLRPRLPRVPGATPCRPSSSSTRTASSSRSSTGPVDEAGASALDRQMPPPAPSSPDQRSDRFEAEPVAVADEPADRVLAFVREHDRASPRRPPGRTARPCARPSRAGSRRRR